MAKPVKTVAEFLATLTGEQRATVDLLRRVVADASPGLSEHVKWNAPSFCAGGDDRVTLGLERDGAVRMVLHRGAKVKDASAFHFEDVDALAVWPAPDRGVLRFRAVGDVAEREAAISSLVRRWIEAVP